MKIIYEKGDVLASDEQVIAHGCNSRGVMGAGLARAVRDKYPEVYEDYRDWCESLVPFPREGLGRVRLVKVPGRIIANCIIQIDYGRLEGHRYVSYDAVDEVMAFLDTKSYTRIAMPMIGAGLGGGSWGVIEKIIEARSTSFQPVVYVL